MTDFKPDGPMQWMRKLVGDWLASDDRDLARLTEWLGGRGLPPVGDDEEPYTWILRGLGQGQPRAAGERAMAAAVAALLDRKVEQELPAARLPQTLYNLFFLAAGLSWPDELCDALDRALQRKAVPQAVRWRGLPLTESLLAALIENQKDARFAPLWRSMLEGRPHDYPGGDLMAGFYGVLWMPPDASKRGRPAFQAIGDALKRVANHLSSTEELFQRRKIEFKALLARVQAAYPGDIGDFTLLHMAKDHQWSEWAWECLPRLAGVVAPSDRPGWSRFLMPESYVSLIGSKSVDQRLFFGALLIMDLPEDEAEKLEPIVANLEKQRRESVEPDTLHLLRVKNPTIPIKGAPGPAPPTLPLGKRSKSQKRETDK